MHSTIPARIAPGRPRDRAGRAFTLAAGCCVLLSSVALAQTTTAVPAENPAGLAPLEEPILYLDPFVVSAAEDRGSYEATATTAATRIRTELKDVGSAISVVTAQFLTDTAARNSQDLLVYMTNTEVGGPRGNFSGLAPGSLDDSQALLSPQTNTRVRGLAAADNTRDFFLTDIPWDSFNTGRIDLQRGPNAMLFGLGSPAGIINASTNSAAFKPAGNVEYRFGSYGSHRATLDFNQVLRPQELAIRLDLLDDRTEYQQRPAFNHDRRGYGALRWDPKFLNQGSAHTSFRINFEQGDIDAERPHVLPPGDNITPWFTTLNRLAVDPATWQSNPALAAMFNASGTGPLAVFANPASSGNTFIAGGAPGVALASVKNPEDYVVKPFSPAESYKFYGPVVLTDRSIFDYVNRMLEGPNEAEWSRHHIVNATLAQTFFHERIGVEAAYDHQRSGNFSTAAAGNSTLSIDVNARLPGGDPNPNFGRPFTGSDVFNNAFFGSTRDASRLTGFADLRFEDFMRKSWLTRLLGRHVFTGFWSHERADKETTDWVSQVGDQAFATHTGESSFTGNLVYDLSYLGPSLADRTSASGAHLNGLQVVQHVSPGTINFFDGPTNAWLDLPLSVVTNYDGSRLNGNHADLTRDDLTSSGLVWQGYLWDGLVVPMAGVRRDRDRSYALNDAPQNPDASVDFASPDYRLPSTPDSDVSGNSTSWSVVVHSPQFINARLPGHADFSLFYNRSNNFQPAAGRIDVLGHPLSPPSGQTRDGGFRLGLFDDRINLKVNWYRTTVTNDALPGFGAIYALPQAEAWGYIFARQTLANNGDGYGGYAGGYQSLGPGQTAAQAKADGIAMATAFLDPKNQPPDSFFDLYRIDRSGWQGFIQGRIPPGFTITGDTVSRGMEYELTAAPTPNWNIAFNASKNVAESHNLAGSVSSWIEQRWAVFNTPVAGAGPNPFTGQPTVVGDLRLFGAATPYTILDLYQPLWVQYQIYRLKDGAGVSELRPWRVNLVTSYIFPRGRLKNLKIGGAYRWQGHEVLGYPVFANANPTSTQVYDFAHPYLGPTGRNIDFWIGYEKKIDPKHTWRVQLNVNNAFAKKDLIPVSVEPDGTPAISRIPEGMVWSVTNSISF
jgi:hypothetical protein